MGTCQKCGRGNGKAAGDNSLCWECYSGRTDAYKNGPKMVGVTQQQSTVPRVSETIKAKPLNGYIRKKWYRNGDLYSGYMYDSLRHGKGKFTKADKKYTYDGDWYMNKRQGHGEENMRGEWRFSGEFYNNKRNGYGKLICNSGEVYEGEWKEDKEHGFGKLVYSSGNTYEGEFFEGKRCGKGKYRNITKNVTYDGEWKNDKLNGYVVESRGDGNAYEGYCVDNDKTGKWKRISPDGTVNIGHWERDGFVIDSTPSTDNISDLQEKTSAPAAPLNEPEEKELDVSPESFFQFLNNGNFNEEKSKEIPESRQNQESAEEAPTVEIFTDFQKRFAYFSQTLYGIDSQGVLHVSSRMKKGKEMAQALDGKENVAEISCANAENIIILGSDGTVVYVDSIWKKGLLSSKEMKDALPEVLGWSELSAVACGSGHFVGLRRDGTVVGSGQKLCHLGEVKRWKNVKQIACGDYGTVGLCTDGTVLSCGFSSDITKELLGWKNISSVVCGSNHVVGLCKDGFVVACGKNSNGQCDVGNFKNVKMISACGQCTAVIFGDGTMKAVGKYSTSRIFDKGIVAAKCCNFGKILSLDCNGNLHGDASGVDLSDFTTDFEW